MTTYLINQDLRDSLIGLLIILMQNSEKTYHKYSGSYTNKLILNNGEIVKLPFLYDLKKDLECLDEVIETGEYDTRVEEMLRMFDML